MTAAVGSAWSASLGRAVTLDDKYAVEDGQLFISGIQALVRVVLDHQRSERRAGRRTGTLVSGYPGSPLGGFDRELARALQVHGADLGIHHTAGLNEDLSAAAMWGSQLAATLPKARYEGVLGIWYGKAPGLDRASDAVRQANLTGTGRLDGVVMLVGDDPTSKSSTVPSASESALAELCMPVFYPGDVQEVVDLGPHAIACSRAAGLWAGFKVVTAVADGAGTINIASDRSDPVLPDLVEGDRPFEHRPAWNILAPGSLVLERSMFDLRLEMARRYERDNSVNELVVSSSDDWLGIVAAGKTYRDLREALRQLRLSNADLERLGIRVWKLGMIYPLHRESVLRFARGLSEVLVLEDKRPFIESHLKQILYGTGCHPEIVGKEDGRGGPLLPMGGELDPMLIVGAIADRLRRRGLAEPFEEHVERLAALGRRTVEAVSPRQPFFCSGCPHTRSTRTSDDTLVGVGIGCHSMVALSPAGHGRLTAMTQMGGEGAQWVGMAPFTDDAHFVQNMGDGTFFHSGSLTLRWAVASGVNITYKLLCNGTVAMTGGQDAVGGRTVPEITRLLAAEGVQRMIVTTDDTSRYASVELPSNCVVRPREQLAEAEAELARTPGVTVLLHDQHCAAESRRLRKRGKIETPDVRVLINERVCEGCGDCGRKSNCLSVVPVETEFGRKTQIHEPSCNKDLGCLEGDCPSFITVRGAVAQPQRHTLSPPPSLPQPAPSAARDIRLRMPGIGGTGVVTISQILSVAALLDGKHVRSLDQTGLAQKGGAVVSDLWISSEPIDGAGKAPAGALDAYLVFDLLAATTSANLSSCDPDRTIAVVSTSRVPTGDMVVDTRVTYPEIDGVISQINEFTRASENVFVDAEALALDLFGDHMQSNPVLIGAAFQAGVLPVSHEALEHAFRLNGVAVERNLAAFEWGRAVVVAPDAVARVRQQGDADPPVALSSAAAHLIGRVAAGPELRRRLEIRVPDLMAYQNVSYAKHYVEFVAEVHARERAATSDDTTPITCAVATHLYKLMAYKDEYEVARLLLDPAHLRALREQVGPDGRVAWRLHPPLLRALGIQRKVSVGPSFAPLLRALIPLRRLRGTGLDPFGKSAVRRTERQLVGEYRQTVRDALMELTPATRDAVVRLCELPDLVRGYETVKLATVDEYRRAVTAALDELHATPEPTPIPLTI